MFQADETKSRELRGNPRGFPLCPRRNKATEGRRRAKLAAKPLYTCCSSSPKISHRCARCDFRGPRLFKGTHIIKSRTFTPSVSRSIGKLSALAQKCDSACASDLARVNLGKLLPAIYCDCRGNPSGFPLCPRRNKATEGRRRAKLAAKPLYTCCSSSPKISHRCARCDFRGPRLFKGTHIIKSRTFTPSVSHTAN